MADDAKCFSFDGSTELVVHVSARFGGGARKTDTIYSRQVPGV